MEHNAFPSERKKDTSPRERGGGTVGERRTKTITESDSIEAREIRRRQFAEKYGQLEKKRGEKSQRPDNPQDYSPLELQVLDLKKKHPGVLLAIEVGYKFRFFGEDAKIASRVLHIAHFVDRNFWVASIPTHRLSVHVRRLVQAGHKVGIVRQTETAALKAAGSNKSGPFERELKELYTKGTYVDEMDNASDDLGDKADTNPHTNYLVCITEENRGGSGPDALVHIGLVAVQPATGDIMYDSFEDGFMRSELETRLLHIEPSEILLPHVLSKPTEKVIKHMSGNRPTVFGDSVRIERMAENDPMCTNYNAAFSFVSDFYTQRLKGDGYGIEINIVYVTNKLLCRGRRKSLASTLQYLSDFGLQYALQLTKYFVQFSSRTHMLLNGNTLANLEIYRNSTDYSENGTLFWIMDHTKTRFGRRMLRKWIGRPLIDVKRLQERVNAVEEIIATSNPKIEVATNMLKKMPDLEQGLSRIHYGLASPKELVVVLDALYKIADTFSSTQYTDHFRFESPILNEIFDALPTIKSHVIAFQEAINPTTIDMPDCKLHFFRSEERWPGISSQKEHLANIASELGSYLADLKIRVPISGLQYSNVAGIEYLLEVKNTQIKNVPKDWIKISGTKAVSRFHTPFLIQKLKERERHREQLTIASNQAYREFLEDISSNYEAFRDVIQALAHLDCLMSLAEVARRPNYTKPTFSDRTTIQVTNGRHPIVEQLLNNDYVPNDIDLDTDGIRTVILTGPNMGGKSSYIRQIALISIMGQIGSYVPADSAHLGILDAIYTRMGAFDNMLKGESTFLVEMHEASDIMKHATPRSLVILDELGRGTSTHDGMAIAYAVLHQFLTHIKAITLFVTHYPFLADEFPSAANRHMGFIENGGNGRLDDVVFLYKLVEGASVNSYGLNVARMADLPASVLEVAKIKSCEMKAAIEKQQHLRCERVLLRCLSDPNYLETHTHELSLAIKDILR
ncbi:muts domain V-domain-containing protein [Dichotomocladium elegans]|nr:muts domain V-domain-containing protein [Dichotomocladium elegans]